VVKIVVGIDGSEAAKNALRWALEERAHIGRVIGCAIEVREAEAARRAGEVDLHRHTSSPLLDALPLLRFAEAGDVSSIIRTLQGDSAVREQRRGLAYHYFGDVSAQQSTKRFEEAIERAYQIQRSG
jgi:nucleotide-binding universal stress UspA family protein